MLRKVSTVQIFCGEMFHGKIFRGEIFHGKILRDQFYVEKFSMENTTEFHGKFLAGIQFVSGYIFNSYLDTYLIRI